MICDIREQKVGFSSRKPVEMPRYDDCIGCWNQDGADEKHNG
jgi:hypothetical protein